MRVKTLPKAFVASAAAIVAVTFSAGNSARAGFDWGADCSTGQGQFNQYIPHYQRVEIGEIPANKRNVYIALDSNQDVDIELYDEETGTAIVSWPNGIINGTQNGGSEECANWQSVRFCYSGYNGDGTPGGLGREWLRIEGDTQRVFVMKAFGYAAGSAPVTYTWESLPTCNEIGGGEFSQFIPYYSTVDVGLVPAGKYNVAVELEATGGDDIDIQVWDGQTKVVQWPDGLINGPGEQEITYRGMRIKYSGYNGINGNWGHERIEIWGRVVPPGLTIRAFGYQAGSAAVTYEWGVGVGATCMGIATLQCVDGLECKAVQTGVSDPAGSCHTPTWCESDATAAVDCANLAHIAVPGYWTCSDSFECQYQVGFPGPQIPQ